MMFLATIFLSQTHLPYSSLRDDSFLQGQGGTLHLPHDVPETWKCLCQTVIEDSSDKSWDEASYGRDGEVMNTLILRKAWLVENLNCPPLCRDAAWSRNVPLQWTPWCSWHLTFNSFQTFFHTCPLESWECLAHLSSRERDRVHTRQLSGILG